MWKTKREMSLASPWGSFALLCLVPLVLWWHALVATFGLALRNDAYTHIFLILPISIALIFLEWESPKPHPQPGFRVGWVLLVMAVLIGFVGGRWWKAGSLPVDEQLSLRMLAVVVWWIGSFVSCFGTRTSRMFIFPLCFLVLLVPPPEFALSYIEGLLQQGSAYAASLLFTIAGVPVTQDGVRLSIPGLTLEVAKECSSIRSSQMLLVTTMVLAHLLLRSTWGKTLVILTAVPLSIAKNGLRIFTLSMLGVYVDPSFLHGWLHHHGGIVFFLVFLVGLLVLLRLVVLAERKSTAKPVVSKVVRPLAVPKATPHTLL